MEKQTKRYMNMAEASLKESRYYLILAKDLGYGDTLALGGGRGVAKDKFWVHDNFAATFKRLTIVTEDAVENDVADLLSRNVYCSEWWRAEFGQLDVVKSSARNLKSLIVQFGCATTVSRQLAGEAKYVVNVCSQAARNE